MQGYKEQFRPLLLLPFLIVSCGLPKTTEIIDPVTPLGSSSNSDGSKSISFLASTTPGVNRYYLWYKIYPFKNQTETDELINTDDDYFEDTDAPSANQIGSRYYYPITFYEENDTILVNEISSGDTVSIILSSDSRDITLTVGSSTFNLRRAAQEELSPFNNKKFWGNFTLDDSDIVRRKNSDFSGIIAGQGTDYAVGFAVQAALLDGESLSLVMSDSVYIGAFYINNGGFYTEPS